MSRSYTARICGLGRPRSMRRARWVLVTTDDVRSHAHSLTRATRRASLVRQYVRGDWCEAWSSPSRRKRKIARRDGARLRWVDEVPRDPTRGTDEHISLPSRERKADPPRVDVVGGVLLAIALGLAVWGLYNPAPDGKQILPPHGAALVAGGGSLRRTQSLPRKIYPIDPGLIPLYDRSGRANLGHALETVVMVELRRRGAELSYLRSESGREVDALALLPDGQKLLVQVCASLHDADTREREVTSLLELADTPTGRSAEPVLISLDARPPDLGDAARRLRWRAAIDWLLDDQT